MSKKVSQSILALACLLAVVGLAAKSALVTDEHGWAYLVRVVNQSNFSGTLEFKNADIAPMSFGPGQSVGDEIAEHSVLSMLGQVPVLGAVEKARLAIQLTRMWDGSTPLTGNSDSRLDKLPTVYGAGVRDITGFDATRMLLLQPMYGQAIAWLATQDLTGPARPQLDMTISFMAYVRDKGEAHIVFSESEKVGALWIWKVVLSASPSGSAKIFKSVGDREVEVASASNIEFGQAHLKPGAMNRFWISLKGNRIVVGQGLEGQNAFMVWSDSGRPKPIKRLGFSCQADPLTIARISTMSAVHPMLEGRPLAGIKGSVASQDGVALREPGLGTLLWQGTGQLSLELTSKARPDERIVVKEEGDSIQIQQLGPRDKVGPVYKCQAVDDQSRFWLMLDGQQLTLGLGAPGKSGQVIGVFKNSLVPQVDRVRFVNALQGNVALFGRGKLAASTWAGSRSRSPMFSGKVKIYQPFAYQFNQQGPVVTGTDLIYKKTHLLGKAPEQGAFYPFELIIDRDGTPAMRWYKEPVNLGKFFMNTAAMMLRFSEAQLYKKAEDYTDEQTSEVKADLKITAKNIGMSLAGGAVGAAASLLETEADLGYRDKDAYGYTEDAKRQLAGKESEQVAKEVKKQILLMLEKAKTLNLKTRKDLDYSFQLYSDMFDKLQDSSLLSGGQRAQVVTSLIEMAASAAIIYQQPRLASAKIARILLSALTNKFFLNRNNLAHAKYSDSLNAALQKIFQQTFYKLGRDKITLPETGGKFLWTGKSFKAEGSVFFQAKGLGELLVHLLPAPQDVAIKQVGELSWLERGQPVYEVAFGAQRNQITCVRASHLGQPVVKTLVSQSKAASMSGLKFKPFWVSYSKGKVSVGQGEWGQGKLMEWADPYAGQSNFLIGMCGFVGPVEVRDVRVGPPVESLTAELIAGKTADEQERDKKLKEEKSKTGLSEVDEQKSGALLQEQSLLDVDFLADYDQLKHDMLAMTDMQLQYGPLEFGDLEIDEYKRAQQEQAIAAKVAAGEKEEKDEDAELEKKKAMQKSKDEAHQQRATRGAAQRLQAEGVYGMQMEWMQFKGIGTDISNVAKGIGKAAKNLGRKIASLKAKFSNQSKRATEREQAGATTALAKREGREAADERQARLRRTGDGDAPDPRDRSDDQTRRVAQEMEDAADDAQKDRDADDGPEIQWADGTIGRDFAQLGGLATSGRLVRSIKEAPDKILHEFSSGRLGKHKSSRRSSSGASSGSSKAIEAMEREKRLRALAAKQDQDDQPRGADGQPAPPSARLTTQDLEFGDFDGDQDAYQEVDRSWQDDRSQRAAMAIAETEREAGEAAERHKKVEEELNPQLEAKRRELDAEADEDKKRKLEKDIEELEDKIREAKDEAELARDVAEMTFYHADAKDVYEARFKLKSIQDELASARGKAERLKAAIAGATDPLRRGKLQEELRELDEKIKGNKDKKIKGLEEQEQEERDKVNRNLRDDTFGQFSSKASAVGAARKAVDDAEAEILRAGAKLEQALKALEDNTDPAKKDELRDAAKKARATLADAEKKAAKSKKDLAEISRYNEDDATIVLRQKELNDIDAQMKEWEAEPDSDDKTAKLDELKSKKQGIVSQAMDRIEIEDRALMRLRGMSPEQWIRAEHDRVVDEYDNPTKAAAKGALKQLGMGALKATGAGSQAGPDETEQEELIKEMMGAQQLLDAIGGTVDEDRN